LRQRPRPMLHDFQRVHVRRSYHLAHLRTLEVTHSFCGLYKNVPLAHHR
jgi:hypothetical protein